MNLHPIFWILFSVFVVSSSVHEIVIVAISNLDDNVGKSVVGGQWLRLQEINNDPSLFCDYKFILRIYNCHSDRQQALLKALNVTRFINTANRTYLPIVLGAPWSSLSVSIAPLLGAFNMAQISVATSAELAKTNKYPYHYRTMPSDALQSEGIILLCTTFNWTSIAVVYVNDDYGLHLQLGIQALASKYNINVTAIAISETEDLTFQHAAEQIKKSEMYITVIIIHDNYLLRLFNTLRKQGILGYPYFYIPTDGWFEPEAITHYNLTQDTTGFVGTHPWQADSLTLEQYSGKLRDIIDQSMIHYEHLQNMWRDYYNNGYAQHLYLKEPGMFGIYGYENMNTIVKVIETIEANCSKYRGNLSEILQYGDRKDLIEMINDTMINQVNYIGPTGRVSFDTNGDRLDGFYALGAFSSDGSVFNFGYLYKSSDGKLYHSIAKDKIIWPSAFLSRGIIPRSNPLVMNKIISIDQRCSIAIIILASLSIIYAFCLMVLQILWKKNEIIAKSSWKLRCFMCVGTICANFSVICFSIDEAWTNNILILSTLCNLRMGLLICSTSLIFVPLFAKTHRIANIFRAVWQGKKIKAVQFKTYSIILFFVTIDVLLLCIFLGICGYQRVYIPGKIKYIDQLQKIQYKYGCCSIQYHNIKWNLAWTLSICIYKSSQLFYILFGILTVWRMFTDTGIWDQIRQFDEIGKQILSMSFTVVILIVGIPIFIFAPNNDVTLHYLLISTSVLLIGNITLSLNLLPRLMAIVTNKEAKYMKTIQKQLEEKLKKIMKKSMFSKSSSSDRTAVVTSPNTTGFKYDHVDSQYYKRHNIMNQEAIEEQIVLRDSIQKEEKMECDTTNMLIGNESDQKIEMGISKISKIANDENNQPIGSSKNDSKIQTLFERNECDGNKLKNLSKQELIGLCLCYAQKKNTEMDKMIETHEKTIRLLLSELNGLQH